MNEDYIFITLKIYLRNFVKLVQLILQILVFIYFVGLYFFILADTARGITISYFSDNDQTISNANSEQYYEDEILMVDFESTSESFNKMSYFLRNEKWVIDGN